MATSDLDAAVEAFRKSFGFRVTRETKGRRALAIGAAEIEFRTGGEASGLEALVLAVDDLGAAEAELRRRGYEPARKDHDGRPALHLGPKGTHGARIVLVED
ncbi:MAG: VOC family protein [Candidatus Binatia bacterium]